MRHEPDVAVIGAGVAGLTVALELADRDFRVTLIDEERAGAASRASAGMLAAGFGFPDAIAPLALAARERFPALLERLRADSDIVVPLDRRGIVELASTEGELERLFASAPLTAERLEAVDLAALDPLLARHGGGLLHPLDGAVDPARLLDALMRCAQQDPRIAVVEHGVASVDLSAAAARVGLRDGTWLTVDRVVVAAGAWVGQLAGLPRAVPVRPVRGELLLLDAEAPRHVVHGAGGYLIPRAEGVLVGATSTEDGFAARTTPDGRSALLSIADRIGQIAGCRVVRHWAGLRPMSPDGLPIVGPDPSEPQVLYAAGLSRNGILFAPWAAAQLAAAMDGEPAVPLEAFSIARFER